MSPVSSVALNVSHHGSARNAKGGNVEQLQVVPSP